MAPCAAFGAMDGSDTTHDLWLVDGAPGKQEALLLTHTPEALDAWATAWRTRVAGQPIAVCREPSRGPRLDALLTDAWVVRSPVHPPTRATSREAFSPSRAQDAPRAADSRRERLLDPRDRLKAWRPDHAKTRTLHELVDDRRRLVHDRPRLSPRMTAWLNASWPQVFHWGDDIRTRLVGDVLLRWPTIEARKQVRPAPLEQVLHAPHSVRQETSAPRRAAITEAVPWTTAPAVMPASGLMITA